MSKIEIYKARLKKTKEKRRRRALGAVAHNEMMLDLARMQHRAAFIEEQFGNNAGQAGSYNRFGHIHKEANHDQNVEKQSRPYNRSAFAEYIGGLFNWSD